MDRGVFSARCLRRSGADHLQRAGLDGQPGSWRAISDGFDNTEGSVQSQQEAQLAADWLDNAKGVMQSAQNLALRIKQDIDNRSGKVSAQEQLSVQGPLTVSTLAPSITPAASGWRARG